MDMWLGNEGRRMNVRPREMDFPLQPYLFPTANSIRGTESFEVLDDILAG